MNRDELSNRSGLPPRQIRYLVAEGVLPAAVAVGRGADAYTEDHLRVALEYRRLHEGGMRHGAIKARLATTGEDPGLLLARHGVELRVVDQSAMASMDDAIVVDMAKAFARALSTAVHMARMEEGDDAGDEQGQAAEGRRAAAGRPAEEVR